MKLDMKPYEHILWKMVEPKDKTTHFKKHGSMAVVV